MNSLKAKILGMITVIVMVIITVVALINMQLQKRVSDAVRQNSLLISETIKSGIVNAIHSDRDDALQSMLATLKSQESIKGVRIFDTSGKILISSDKGEIGRMVGSYELSASLSGSDIQNKILLDKSSRSGAISLIRNNSECRGCHDTSRDILGVLEIDLGMDHLSGSFADLRNISFLAAAITILLITITISIYIFYYVDMPVRQLIRAMQQVEEGDFAAKPVISSSDEMQLLSESHNRMVEKLKEQMDTAINHERALATAQEKLAHHREIYHMNEKLEEQLGEIENLNINLEERIEEIEGANRKITELAEDLEEKNSNLERAVDKLSTLHKVGLAINSTMEMERLFKLIVKITTETLHAQIGYIVLVDREKSLLKVTTLHGHNVTISPEGTEFPMHSANVSTWVIRNCKPLLITDINETPEFDRFSSLGYEKKTLICAPLMTKDEIIGTITVVNKIDDSVYTNEELELLNTIAAQASIAIKNAKLYDEQQKIYMNTIHALVSAIEASDSYTRGHSERVTRYSMELARKLDLPPDRMQVIERAAILHDIGKIGIDLNLLHKTDELTPADVFDLQQHPVIGMNILQPIEFLHDVRICIGQHHERYDGQGYPHNVPGDKLLMESRILAIADAFDAMTSDRPYRKALPARKALQELIDNAGSQFDPALVIHFVELLESGAFSFQKTYHSMTTRPVPHLSSVA
jgi:putative nucleotidyltransferase with HDIG domain